MYWCDTENIMSMNDDISLSKTEEKDPSAVTNVEFTMNEAEAAPYIPLPTAYFDDERLEAEMNHVWQTFSNNMESTASKTRLRNVLDCIKQNIQNEIITKDDGKYLLQSMCHCEEYDTIILQKLDRNSERLLLTEQIHRLSQACRLPTCSLCLETYTDESGTHVPKTLLCGHTFCRICLETMATSKQGGNVCPYDRQSFVPSHQSTALPTNFAIISIIQNSKQYNIQTLQEKETQYLQQSSPLNGTWYGIIYQDECGDDEYPFYCTIVTIQGNRGTARYPSLTSIACDLNQIHSEMTTIPTTTSTGISSSIQQETVKVFHEHFTDDAPLLVNDGNVIIRLVDDNMVFAEIDFVRRSSLFCS